MIFVDNNTIKESDFISLLSKTKSLCIDEIKRQKIKKMSGVEFEGLTFDMMCHASKGTKFKGDIQQTGLQTFPDIIARKFYGTEVKATADDKWQSTGNSILESTRVTGVERIYMFFGKFGGSFDVKYRLYQECLNDIGVTHSPRYKINMDLLKGQSIFDKIGIDYDVLRKDANPIQKIKAYYNKLLKEGEELWWIDQSSDTVVNPIIRPFSKFSEEEKREFIIESMILFPEIFSSSTVKFERLASYLVINYNAVSSNIRDLFTAGGKKEIDIISSKVKISQILFRLYERAEEIKSFINKIDKSKLLYYWRVSSIEADKVKQWLKLIDEQHTGTTHFPSTIFNAGLNKK